jgi:nitronate monooxygenase
MAGVQGSALAIAVSNAGGLGSLPCAMLDVDGIGKELTAIRAGTSRPFNVNFFCHSEPELDVERGRAWRAALSPYFAEYGIDAAEIQTSPGRAPFSAGIADVLEEFRPPVVSFHFGLPSPDLLARVRARGAKILSSATTVEEARWLEAHGVDAVIAQGLEAGGHRGNFLSSDLATQVATLALVPQVVAAVRVPVIAAGGIADARGVAAAMALGAAGVQIGTAYLLCHEATTSALHRAALKSDRARSTAITNLLTGRPARGIVNRIMRELGPMSAAAPPFPLAAQAVVALRAKAEALGRDDFSSMWAGQNATGCREVPAADMTRELAAAVRRSGRHTGYRTSGRYTHCVDFATIKQVLAAFEREGVRYAIFGAAALNLHGLARFTEDLDVFLEPTADNIAGVRRALSSVFDDPSIAQITAEDLLGDYPAVQYVPPTGTFHLDLLTRLGQAFAFGDLEIVRVPFDDLTVSVVSPRTLYRMKRDTVRLKDKADAALLKERFGIEDP